MNRVTNSYRPRESLEFRPHVDPVTFEVIRHRIWQANLEQAQTMIHSSGSIEASEAADLNAGIMNRNGEAVIVGPFVFFHLACLASVTERTAKFFAEDDIEEGDMYFTNDPWVGAFHQADVTVIAPAHWDKRLIGWTGCVMHQSDLGGPTPGGWSIKAENVYQESPRYRFLRIVQKDRIRKEVLETIACNSRLPEMVELNVRAMVAANLVAKGRLFELFRRYGVDTVENVMNDMLEYSDVLLRHRLREIPDGEWYGEDYVEHDGIEDKLFGFKVTLKKEGDKLSFDFTESSEQARGFINTTEATARAGLLCAVSTFLCNDIPWNSGLLRPIEIITRLGSVVDAQRPAPLSLPMAWAVVGATASALGKMLSCSPIHEKRMMAQWMAGFSVASISGRNRDGTVFVQMCMDMRGGGGGARYDRDGIDGAGNLSCPWPLIPNVESVELRVPILYLSRGRLVDSQAAGSFRGGSGVYTAFTLYGTDSCNFLFCAYGCDHYVGHSLKGGYPGTGGFAAIYSDSDAWQRYASGDVPSDWSTLKGERKVLESKQLFELHYGDVCVFLPNCGGSIGDPLERELIPVADDVREGILSLERAQAMYGVVVDTLTLQPDFERTKVLRDEIRAERLRKGEPNLQTPVAKSASAIPPSVDDLLKIGGSLYVKEGLVYCRYCHGGLCVPSENPKLHLLFLEKPLKHASPWVALRFGGDSERFNLREYICPFCGTLLFVDQRLKSEEHHWDDYRVFQL